MDETKKVIIYQLKTLGYDQLQDELNAVNESFEKIKASKTALNKMATSTAKSTKEETAEIKKQREELAALKVEEQRLRIERAKLTNESKAANLARQAEIKQQREAKAAVEATAGSYNALNKQFKELYALVKSAPKGSPINFQGQTLGFDQAIGKLQELAAAEQDFRRQFSKDGLLVGEYTSGIVQAFKQMGLDDLVGGQVQKANERLGELDSKADELRTTLSQIKVTGEGSFQAIEKELIDNRNEAIALKKQLSTVEQELRGMGDVGTRITGAIGEGFKQLKGQVGQFALSFIGIQALFSKLSSEISASIDTAKELEGVENAFKRLNDPGLLDRLREATKGTVSDLELMKAAINAKNFEIPFDKFTTLLEFARRRAQETGQSVDFLVNSIVTGIGRKSPQILDNLQISATRIKSAFEGVNAETLSTPEFVKRFTSIIDGELADMGGEIDLNTQKIAQQQAQWENMRAVLGSKLLPVLSALGGLLLFLANNLTVAIPLIVVSIGLTNTWAGSLLRLVGAFALEKTAMIIERGQLIATNAVRAASITLTNIYTLSLIRSTAATGAAAIAFRVLAATIAFLTSPLGIAVGLIAAFTTVIGIFSANASKANDAIDSLATSQSRLAATQRINDELNRRVIESTGNQIARLRNLEKVTTDTGISENTRRKALNELISISPKYQEALTKEGIQIDKVRAISDELVNSLKEQAKARAIVQLATEKEKRKEELETQLAGIGKADPANEKGAGAFIKNLAAAAGLGDGTVGQQRRELLNQLGDVESELKVIYDRVQGNTSLQNQIIEGATPPAGDEKGKGKGSTIADKQAAALKLIDARLNEQLATLKLSLLNQEITEEQFLADTLTANRVAYDEKLKIVKGGSLEELATIAALKEKQKQLEVETADQIFTIRQKAIDQRVEQRKKEIDAELKAVTESPLSSEEAKIDAQLKADQELLNLQISFNQDMDTLEKQYNKTSVENAFDRSEALRSINRQLTQDQVNQLQNDVKVLEQEGKTAIAKFQEEISKARLNISSSAGKGKEKASGELDKAENRGVLGIEVANLQKLLPKYKDLLDQKLITEEQYYQYLKELNDKTNELNESMVTSVEDGSTKIQSLGQLIQSGLSKMLKADKGGELEGLIGDVVSQSYDLAKQAMNGYFDAERERIQQSRDAQIQRLDEEKERVKARAQSQEEEASIDAQYAAKKRAIEIAAGEQIKKTRRAEAKIALAAELGNLAVAAAQNPLNGITFGAAGIAMYGLLAGLAIGRYALRVGEINKAQFEQGGIVPTSTGGKIEGPSHAGGGVPFNYEAEGGELAIIRTKNAPQGRRFSISGTHTQIASALNSLGGGKAFMPGAKLSKFEYGGSLGETLQAPVFSPASNSAPDQAKSDQFNEMIETFFKKIDENNTAINKRIDRIKVHMVHRDITDSLKTTAGHNDISTL